MPNRSSVLDRNPGVPPTKIPDDPLREYHNEIGCVAQFGDILLVASAEHQNDHGNAGAGRGAEDVVRWIKEIPLLNPEHRHMVEQIVRELRKLEGIELWVKVIWLFLRHNRSLPP